MQSNNHEGTPMKRGFGALVAVALMFGASLAQGQEQARDSRKPLLLAASPALQGPYSGTAIIVVPMGQQHVGFILNRSTGMHLAKLFPGHEPSAKVVDPVAFGGPEASQAIFAVRRGNPGQPSVHLFGDLYMTGNKRVVDSVIETTPNDARYFAGFVGWQAGELAAELEAGWWHAGEADEALVLRRDTDEMWPELLKRFGKDDAPGKPSRPAPGMQTSELSLSR